MEKEKIFNELRNFIDKNWFYEEEENYKVINVDYLLDFINWLEKEV